MAFSKFAKASVVHPSINFKGWDTIRSKANVDIFHQREAAKVVLQKYDPKDHLLSHCTIVASVDTENGPGNLGRQVVNGFQIDRKYHDYYVTPETTKYVNNNFDCWSRPLLLSSFRTFVGAESYLEHIQIPELSKGKIIDAAARDIGDSIYIDILVANERKHKQLVAAILNGTLSTLSMGAQVQFTICTKCGNVAYDETQLCPCIKYAKGSTFFDANGQKRIVAEQCGNIAAEPGSNKFIEASWVGNPAFKGAVLRGILTEKEIANLGGKFAHVLSQPVRVVVPGGIAKAAKLTKAQFGADDTSEQTPAPAAPKEEVDPIKKVVEDLANTLREQVTKKVQDDIGKSEADSVRSIDENQNDTLIRSAMEFPAWQEIGRKVASLAGNRQLARKILAGLIIYKSEGWSGLVKTGSFTGRELLSVSRVLDILTNRSVKAGETRLYKTVLAAGGMAPYQDIESYLLACRRIVGRDLSSDEVSSLIDHGRLFNLGS